MKLKNFNDYSTSYSKDPKTFEKRVAFACSENTGIDLFDIIERPEDARLSEIEIPVIIWNNFNKNTISESTSFIFKSSTFPKDDEFLNSFSEEAFIPKFTKERKGVADLKFPIIGKSGDTSQEFKTYGKFKKSEKQFDLFKEKITPVNRFEIICFGENPIHVQEKINGIGFDTDLPKFKYENQLVDIIKKINLKYPNDFYQVDLLEANNKLYLEKITNSSKLSPSQSVKLYETAYENFYSTKLPKWFKNNLFEKYVSPYYKSNAYHAMLIKPKHSIDFKKYIN